MKKLLSIALLGICYTSNAQTFISLSTDIQGDDYFKDAKELSYYVNASEDSLYVKIETFNPRSNSGDFGYALAIDTNLNINDGSVPNQTNIYGGTPNTSLKADIMLFAYQNGMFPTVYTEVHDDSGMPMSINFSADTSYGLNAMVFKIPIADIGKNSEVNIVGFTGSFDISSSGPSDAIPNNTYAEIRDLQIGLAQELNTAFSIYPNPTSQYFKIDNLSNQKLELYSSTGKKVMEWEHHDHQKVDCSKLPKGFYILQNTAHQSLGKVFIY